MKLAVNDVRHVRRLPACAVLLCGVGFMLACGAERSAEAAKGSAEGTVEKTVEIKEKMFLTQVNDVYLNPEDYLGKTIKLEGLFKMETYTGEEQPACFVLRYGPGCCGNDGNAGFEVAWDKAAPARNPLEDDWVEATGVLKRYEADGFPYLYLSLTNLAVLDKRGAEVVSQ